MRPPVQVLEQLSRVAPLGVVFRDEATGALVSDGLQVSAFPDGQPGLRRAATVNRSGVHVLMNLPGLRALESGAGDAAYWSGLTGRQPFTIEVEDTQGRYQPFSFHAQLPYRGLFQLFPSTPQTTPPFVPLYSAPSRTAASTLASLHAELWDTVGQAPAAWALVEAKPLNGPKVRGIADAQGRVALFFPYPPPVETVPKVKAASPPVPVTQPLLQQEWPVRLHVYFARRAVGGVAPDLNDTLSQPATSVAPDTSHWQTYVTPTLRYGQELVAKTSGEPRSRLWIKPVGSPP